MINRKKLTNQLYDLNHKDYCLTEGFHAIIDSTCFCKFCGHRMEYYHDRYVGIIIFGALKFGTKMELTHFLVS